MQIKFLTINILHGGMVWDNLVEFIHQQKPDILALQEVYDSHDESLDKRFRTMDEFKSEFSFFLPYSSFGATVIDAGNGDTPWGNAIFSKFEILNSRTIFFDLLLQKYDFKIDPDPRMVSQGMLESEVVIGDKNVFVYSWHGVWDSHGCDTEKRRLMGDTIVSNIKDKEWVILAGDSNMDHVTEVTKNLENYLQNVFGGSLKSTFNMKYKDNPSYATASVDKIMVSKNIKIISKEQPSVDVSDHYPLMVELEV